MISPILATIKYFDPQLDLTKSPCHRKMTSTETLINLITYKSYTSTISKTIAIATLVFGAASCLAVCLGSAGVGLFLIVKVAILTHPCSEEETKTVGLVIFGIVAIVVGIYAFFIDSIKSAYSSLQHEKKIVEALGGQAAFDSYPTFPTTKISELHTDKHGYYSSYLSNFKPEHFHEQGVTEGIVTGVDCLNRPVICIHAKQNFTSCVATIVGNKGPWWHFIDSNNIFGHNHETHERLKNLKDLRLGIHPFYKLVTKDILPEISFKTKLADTDFFFV